MKTRDDIVWHDLTEWLPTEDGEIQVRVIAGTLPDYVYQVSVPLDADALMVERMHALIAENLRSKGKIA